MVSSSLDKSIKKALAKDTSASSLAAGTSAVVDVTTSSINNLSSAVVSLPPEEKIEILFPKCKPRIEYSSSLDMPHSSDLISITSPTSSSSLHSTVLTTATTTLVPTPYNNNNLTQQQHQHLVNKQQLKLQSQPLSPDHKKQQHPFSKLSSSSSSASAAAMSNNKHELNDNYVETNPFRIGSNNRFFYAQQNDSLFNNNSTTASSAALSSSSTINNNNNNAMMHHYHYQPSSSAYHHSSYQQDSRNYFLEPDEIEHNPYTMDVPAVTATTPINTLIPSSILKTTPPDTPPALQPCTTPVDSSPLGSSRNLWDLSPIKIKSSTPTRIKSQSPSSHYTRPHRGSYKKLLASPVPIEEDLETGHYYYNNKKTYYQAPQTDSDSNEPVTFNDVHENEKIKPKSAYFATKAKANANKMKHSESSDVIYAEVRKKEERKMVKSKSGSGIMEYDGSPRRFGVATNDDFDYYSSQSNYKYGASYNTPPPPLQSSSTIGVNGNYSSPSPPRPGFPQRILSYEQSAQNLLSKSYSFDDQQLLASPFTQQQKQQQQQSITTTSTLIPTTFINNSAYEMLSSPPPPQEKTQTTIEEEPEIVDIPTLNEEEELLDEENVVDEEEVIVVPETVALEMQEKPQSEVMIANTTNATTTTSSVSAFDMTSPTEENLPTSTFDYLYEFSETRKVLEEFFKCPDDKIKEFEKFSDFNESDDSLDIQYDYHREQIEKEMESLYCGSSVGGNNGISIQQQQHQISSPMLKREEDSQLLDEDIDDDNRDDRVDDKEEEAYVKAKQNGFVVDHKEKNNKPFDYYLDSASRSSLENVDQENELDNVNNARNIPRRMSKINNNNNNNNNNSNNNSITSGSYQRRQSKNFNYSPDTTDYDSESSMRFITSDYPTNIPKMIHTATNVSSSASAAAAAAMVEMSGGPNVSSSSSSYAKYCTSMPVLEDGLSSGHASDNENNNPIPSSNDFYNKRNSSNIASSSTISTIQKQYQENLVQTHANNNIFYTNNNNTSSSSSNNNNTSHGMVKSSSGNNNSSNNGVLLNNGDLEQPPPPQLSSKVRSAQSPLNYHPYYAMRYDTTPSTATSTATIKEPSSSTSLRYDVGGGNNNNGIANNNNKELTTSRYENGKELLNASSTSTHGGLLSNNKIFKNRDPELESLYTINTIQLSSPPPPAPVAHRQLLNDAQFNSPPMSATHQLQQQQKQESEIQAALKDIRTSLQRSKVMNANNSPTPLFNTNNASNMMNNNSGSYYDRTPVIPEKVESPTMSLSPVWIPRSRDKSTHSPIPLNETGSLLSKHNKNSDDEDEEEIDTDLETDRLLGHQMLDDGFYDDKGWNNNNGKQHRPLLSASLTSKISPKVNQQPNSSSITKSNSSSLLRHGLNNNTLLPTSSSSDCCMNNANSPASLSTTPLQQHSLKTSPALNLNSGNMMNLIHPKSGTSPDRRFDVVVEPSPRKLEDLPEQHEEISSNNNNNVPETNDLCNLDGELVDSPGGSSSDKSTSNNKDTSSNGGDKKKKNKNKEDTHTTVLIEGVLFRARYLGSTQLVCEGQPTKSTRMMQAEEAVSRIKALAPDGENQPSTEVDLFISTEKIMVLNTDLKEIMMDHALRTISYIADIGDLVVLMARRRFVPQDHEANSDSGTGTGGSGNVSGGSGGPTPPTSGKINRTPKMICHVFESEEAQFIAQSIGQAFQVAYMEFLKANGIEDHSFMKEMDYQEVLNSQEIFGDELEIFAKKELQKEVVVPKAKGEILGVVIVESGWGSMLPTVVIANLASNGAAARCGQLNIGDQIIAINGLSLVGLPLSQCQQYIKNTKNQTVVKFTVVPCPPVVEVKIKRPNTKYQLGFSVQNGVICSLLRGGIAERGGVRVGHRIIEINNQSVVAVPHEKIVNLLATSVGEILMKTMPTSMFRLLTGQENPIYI